MDFYDVVSCFNGGQAVSGFGRNWPVVLWTLICVSLAVGCQSEKAKWEFASAELAARSVTDPGERRQAIVRMQQALEIIGKAPRLKLRLADYLAEEGDENAIRLCDEILVDDQTLADSALHLEVLQRKMLLLQKLGQFDAALQVCKQTLADHVSRSPDELNLLAYCRGLAGRELMIAAKEIDEAILAVEGVAWPSKAVVPLAIQTELAIALLSRDVDAQATALEVLDYRVDQLQIDLGQLQNLALSSTAVDANLQTPLDQQLQGELKRAQDITDVLKELMSWVLTVRALLYQDLNRLGECKDDRQLVRQLGHDADKMVQRLPDTTLLEPVLRIGVAFFDTRGFVLGQLPWDEIGLQVGQKPGGPLNRTSNYREALADLNVAVTGAQVFNRLVVTGKTRSAVGPVQEMRELQAEMKRTEAAILYHRMLVHQRNRSTSEAQQDQAAIEHLGFEPSAKLF